MEHPGCGDRASDLQDNLPGEGRTAKLPSGRMTGKSGYKDSNAGELRATACHRHSDNFGGTKIPPPTVRPMRHAGPQAGLEGKNPATTECARRVEWKRRRLAEVETRENSERAFEAYREPIKNVSDFKYWGGC